MTKEEIKAKFEDDARYFPERMSGNAQADILTKRMELFIQSDRTAVLELLHDWLGLRIRQSERKPDDGKRECWMWLALGIVEKYRLAELKHDVENLISDIHSKKAFLPYYEDMVWKYYNALCDEKK